MNIYEFLAKSASFENFNAASCDFARNFISLPLDCCKVVQPASPRQTPLSVNSVAGSSARATASSDCWTASSAVSWNAQQLTAAGRVIVHHVECCSLRFVCDSLRNRLNWPRSSLPLASLTHSLGFRKFSSFNLLIFHRELVVGLGISSQRTN